MTAQEYINKTGVLAVADVVRRNNTTFYSAAADGVRLGGANNELGQTEEWVELECTKEIMTGSDIAVMLVPENATCITGTLQQKLNNTPAGRPLQTDFQIQLAFSYDIYELPIDTYLKQEIIERANLDLSIETLMQQYQQYGMPDQFVMGSGTQGWS